MSEYTFLEKLNSCDTELEGQRVIAEEFALWELETLKKIEDLMIHVSVKSRSKPFGEVDWSGYGDCNLQNFLNELILDVDENIPNKEILKASAKWAKTNFPDSEKGWKEFKRCLVSAKLKQGFSGKRPIGCIIAIAILVVVYLVFKG
jgi:hypothetical protein